MQDRVSHKGDETQMRRGTPHPDHAVSTSSGNRVAHMHIKPATHCTIMRLRVCEKNTCISAGFFWRNRCNMYIHKSFCRVAKTHRIPYLYRSFSAKEPYI